MSEDARFISGLLFIVLGNTTTNNVVSTIQYLIGITFLIVAIKEMGRR